MKKNTNELVANNKCDVETVAKQYLNQGLTLEQLIEEGNKGLEAAAKRYDANKGYAFMSYAVWWIRQSILQALTKAGCPNGEEAPLLTDREMFIIQHYFGYDCEQMTIEEIAHDLNITPERVLQVKERALRKIKSKLEESRINK